MQPAYYEDFTEIKKKIWSMLDDAVTNRSSQFRIPTFICGHNNDIDGRIVVLRKSDQKNNLVQFHSDIRSDKIELLKNNPNAALLFYDKDEKIQLRIFAQTKINHKNKITMESWRKTAHMSRQCYLGNKAPGSDSSKATSGLAENVDNMKYSIEESEIGYKNFCVIENYIKSIEWLYLAAKGHRRAHFSLENSSIMKKWLIP